MDTDENGFQVVHPLGEAEPIYERVDIVLGARRSGASSSKQAKANRLTCGLANDEAA